MSAIEQLGPGARVVRLLAIVLVTLDGLLALLYFYLAYRCNRPVKWVNGSPLRWFSETLTFIGVAALPKILLGSLKTLLGRRALPLNDRWISILAGATAVSLYLFAIYPEPPARRSGLAGQWLHDEFVELLIPDRISGPLLAAEGYDVPLELRNRTSVPLIISRVTMKRFSKKGARLFRRPETLVYTGEDHVSWYLEPHQKDERKMRGNQILPERVEVSITHNLSTELSIFNVDLDAIEQQLKCRPPLDHDNVYRGMDALVAIEMSSERARAWNSEARIEVAFPGDNKTYFDAHTGLKFLEVTSWVVNWCGSHGKMLATIVSKEGVQHAVEPEKAYCLWKPVALPRMGNQAALDLASRSHLLCGDWDNLRLIVGKQGEAWIAAWQIPYLGPDSLPLTIDASTGARLDITGVGESGIEDEPEYPKFEISP